MTVVVSFLCSDGVVVAADSMLTPSMNDIHVGHHKGIKVDILSGPQICAFAGDQGQAARFLRLAELNASLPSKVNHPLEYPIALTKVLIQEFEATGIKFQNIGINTILAFHQGASAHCCVFEGQMQPRMLDKQHFYVALGSGKLSADPFLRFLVDIFCQSGQPTIKEARILAAWTVQHAINTSFGGIAGPIRMAVFECCDKDGFSARCLSEFEIEEYLQTINKAIETLRGDWNRGFQGDDAFVNDIADPPVPPRL